MVSLNTSMNTKYALADVPVGIPTIFTTNDFIEFGKMLKSKIYKEVFYVDIDLLEGKYNLLPSNA